MHKIKLIYILILAMLFESCHNKPGAPAKIHQEEQTLPDSVISLTEKQIKNAGIETGLPEQKHINTTVKVSGTIDVPPEAMVSVSMPMPGYIKKTTLLPGQQVKKGEVLAVLEDMQYIQLQEDYLTAKSRLAILKEEYERQQKLNATKATSEKIYRQAQGDYERQRIQLKSLSEKLLLININPDRLTENNLSRTVNLLAPITGYVTKVNVNMGKYVNPTDVLYELANNSELHLSLTVFENDAPYIKEGQKVVCYTNNGKKHEAEVHFINLGLDKDRSTEVHCHFKGDTRDLLPGMYMKAEIAVNDAQSNCLPEGAIVRWNNQTYVFTAEADNKFIMHKIEPGVTKDGIVSLLGEIPKGKLVTKNAYAILMKMKNNGEGE